jgi:hypothetical protein
MTTALPDAAAGFRIHRDGAVATVVIDNGRVNTVDPALIERLIDELHLRPVRHRPEPFSRARDRSCRRHRHRTSEGSRHRVRHRGLE